MSVFAFLGPILVLIGGTNRVRLALVITTVVTLAGAALVEPWFVPDPLDDAAWWYFFWIWLPGIVGVLAGVTATLTAGRRSFFVAIGAGWLGALIAVVLEHTPSGVPDDFWECVFDVATPAVLASSFAVMVAAVSARRV